MGTYHTRDVEQVPNKITGPKTDSKLDGVDLLSSETQEDRLQLRCRMSQLELELEKAKVVCLGAERRAENALQAQTKVECELGRMIDMTVEASHAAELAIHAQMEAEQRAELAMVEAERAKQAQYAAEQTAEIALREAEAMRKRLKQIEMRLHALGLTKAHTSDTCSSGLGDALGPTRPPDDESDYFPLPNSSPRGGPVSQEEVLTSMREKAARKEHNTTFKHVSGPTLVACGAGLKVTAFSCGFDNGLVQIHNLPLDMEADHIASLLTGTGTPFVITDTSLSRNGTLCAAFLVKAEKTQAVVDQMCNKTVRGRILRANVVGAERISRLQEPHYELQVTWEPPAHEPSLSNINVELGRLLDSSPGLTSIHFAACDTTGRYTAATAEFDSWTSAERANTRLGLLGLEKDFPSVKYNLRPNQPTRYILCIPLDQHYLFEDEDSVKERRSLMTSEEQAIIIQTDYLGSDWFDGWLWSFDQSINKLMEQLLSREDIGIYKIARDWLSRMLIFHAESQQAIDAASAAIRKAAARSKLARYQTRISGQLVRSLHDRDTPNPLHEQLGTGAISINVMCSHYVLEYHGGYPTDMIEKVAMENRADGTEEKAPCPICLAEVVEPIGLGCGHEYCASCLRGYLITAPERNRFPVTCIGNDDACQRPVSIPVIQTVLSITQFYRLVDKAVSSYVDQHPNELRYCPTPGCTQIYRCNKDKKALVCPSCSTSVCSACNSKDHPGRTCPEQRACTDPNEQERLDLIWASRNGAKECPSCHVWIQKTTGCNHVHCRLCNAHICWLCLAKYKTAKGVYGHLREVHGSLGLPTPMMNCGDQDVQLARQLQMHEVVQANQAHTVIGMRDIVRRENVYGRQIRERDSCIVM